MRVFEINGAIALRLEPGDLGALWRRITGFLASNIKAEWTRQKIRAYERELAKLPDYLLADIGVKRSDLVHAAPRWRPDTFRIFSPDPCAHFWTDNSSHSGRNW